MWNKKRKKERIKKTIVKWISWIKYYYKKKTAL